MIKKAILAIMVAIPMCVAAQSPKFGVVNAEEIVTALPDFTEAQNKIAAASKQYEDEYARLNEQLQKNFADYQKLEQDAATPQSIKERRLQEMQDLDKKAQQFAQTASQDIQRQQAQLMQPIEEKVMQAIKAVGANNNFTMIFPGAVPAYVSADVVDVTPLVKTELGIK